MEARFGLGATTGLAGIAGRLVRVRYGAALGWTLPRMREAHSPKEILRASADRLNASARVGGGGLCALMAGRDTEGIGVSPGFVGESREDCGESAGAIAREEYFACGTGKTSRGGGGRHGSEAHRWFFGTGAG